MGTIVYGTKTFSKNMGYYGPKELCIGCGRTYKTAIVKYTSWFHIDYLPIIPTKKKFFKMCPVCGAATELQKDNAKQLISKADNEGFAGFEALARHIMADKPKGILATDNSYQIWVKDLSTGEEICVQSNATKEDIKQFKLERGYKKLPIERVD